MITSFNEWQKINERNKRYEETRLTPRTRVEDIKAHINMIRNDSSLKGKRVLIDFWTPDRDYDGVSSHDIETFTKSTFEKTPEDEVVMGANLIFDNRDNGRLYIETEEGIELTPDTTSKRPGPALVDVWNLLPEVEYKTGF